MKGFLNRGVFIAAMLLALLVIGCTAPSGGNQPELRTSSDQSETQRRAAIRVQLAAGYYQQHQWETALDEINKALAIDPKNADAYSVRAMIYLEMGEMGPAETNFNRALALAPNDPDLSNNYGWFLCQTGQEAKSIAYFEAALKNRFYRSPQKALNNAGVCSLKMKNEAAAENYFTQASRHDPADPTTNANMAKLHYARGAYDRAHYYISRIGKAEAMTADMLWTAIKIARKRGDRSGEAMYVAELRRLHPESAEFAAYRRGAFHE